MLFPKQDECINKIIEFLPQNTINYIFLIGSFAKNENNENSDIDLLVVSDVFKTINGYLRQKIIKTTFDEVQQKFDIICLTNEEFNRYKQSNAYNDEYLRLIFRGDTL
ncbi:MAG: nucleotidyltransferase domain-containing protein [Ruminococcaceae bacterium]|nr:nucleotidyltransferase domain-containing protein [Oscillospiraceae bacterium]